MPPRAPPRPCRCWARGPALWGGSAPSASSGFLKLEEVLLRRAQHHRGRELVLAWSLPFGRASTTCTASHTPFSMPALLTFPQSLWCVCVERQEGKGSRRQRRSATALSLRARGRLFPDRVSRRTFLEQERTGKAPGLLLLLIPEVKRRNAAVVVPAKREKDQHDKTLSGFSTRGSGIAERVRKNSLAAVLLENLVSLDLQLSKLSSGFTPSSVAGSYSLLHGDLSDTIQGQGVR